MGLLIRTQRLELRPLAATDLQWLNAFNSDPGVRRFLFDDEVWTEAQTIERLIEPNAELWSRERCGLLVVQEGGTPVGWAGFWYFHEPPVREVGYALAPAVWGRGLAGEASLGVMWYGMRHLGDDAFRASTDAPNVASVRVLEKLGFVEQRRSAGPVHATVHFWRPADESLSEGVRIDTAG